MKIAGNKMKFVLAVALAFLASQAAPASPPAIASAGASAAVVLAPGTPPLIDDNAALRYVTAAAHLASASPDFASTTIAWAEGPATGTLASWAAEYACRQERPRTFLLLGDRQSTCSFTPDNQGFELYEMPPCAALEHLAETQAVAALHLPDVPTASAAHLLAAVFRMGDRLAHHGVLLSRMTGTRIRRLALGGMRHLLARPGTDIPAARLIVDRLGPVPPLRREVIEQVNLDVTYLRTLLAAGKSRPELLVKFGFERHPAVLALPAVIALLERGGGPRDLAAVLTADPVWERWVAGLEEYFARAAAIDPLSPTADHDFGILISGPAANENPLIGCLSWDFSWVHRKLSESETELAETLALAQRHLDRK